MSNEELLEKFRLENRKMKLQIEELEANVLALSREIRASEEAYLEGEESGYQDGWDEGFAAGIEEGI